MRIYLTTDTHWKLSNCFNYQHGINIFFLGLLDGGYLQMNLFIKKEKIITRKYLSSTNCVYFPVDFKMYLNIYKSKQVSGINAFII